MVFLDLAMKAVEDERIQVVAFLLQLCDLPSEFLQKLVYFVPHVNCVALKNGHKNLFINFCVQFFNVGVLYCLSYNI